MTVPDDLCDMRQFDGLLDGGAVPAEAHPAYAHLAALVRSAQSPPTAEELAGEDPIVTAMQEAVLESRDRTASPDRGRTVTRTLVAKAVIAATVGALGVAAAAATGGIVGLLGEPPGVHELDPAPSTTERTPSTITVPASSTPAEPGSSGTIGTTAAESTSTPPVSTTDAPAGVPDGSVTNPAAPPAGVPPAASPPPDRGVPAPPPNAGVPAPPPPDPPPPPGGVPPGYAGTTPGQAGTTPGQGGAPPGQDGTAPGLAGTAPSGGAAPPGPGSTPPAGQDPGP